MSEVRIDSSINGCKRGIYGIFISRDDKQVCAYIGKSEQIGVRAEKHKNDIESGNHIDSLNDAYKEPDTLILITLLEAVPYIFDDYNKDAQRLASAENKWIDKYQANNQCLEQVPEGKRPSKEVWEKMKKEAGK